jgi:cell division protein FtsA
LKMARDELITGLDVGTTKVCAVIAEIEPESRPNIIGVGTYPCAGLKKGIVVDIESTTHAIHNAITGAERMAGREVRSVVVGVTGEHIACLNSRSVVAITHSGREISSNDVERLLDSARVVVLPPDREIIHAIPRWYSVDGQVGVRSPVGMHGNRLEVETHVVTGLSSFLQNVVKCVDQAGLSVSGVVLEPIATAESVLLPAEEDLGVALLDIGGGTSDLAIYFDGQIYHSVVIPVGGNHVTRDIAVGLRTTIEEAERVKLLYGCALVSGVEPSESFEVSSLGSDKVRQLPRKVLAEIIEPRMVEVCHLMQDQIKKAGCEERLPAGLVFTGGGAQLPGLPELASAVTGLAARVGTPTGVSGLVEAVRSPSCATAVGLVLFWDEHESKQPESDGTGSPFVSNLIRRIRDLFAKISGE